MARPADDRLDDDARTRVVAADVLLPPGKPRRRAPQKRAAQTVDSIIEAAIGLLEQEGEEGIHVAAVAHAAGVSHGAVYHHFGSLDALVQAAQFRRLARQPTQDIDALRGAVETVADVGELGEVIDLIARAICSPERRAVRRMRAEVIAASGSRPALADALRSLETSIARDLVDAVSAVDRRGFLRPGLDPVAVAGFLEAVAFGVVLLEFVDEPPGEADLASVVAHAFRSFIIDGTTKERSEGPSH